MAYMLIRWGLVDDAEQICEVHVLGWQLGYRGMLPQTVLDELEPAQRMPRWTRTLAAAEWPRRGTLVVTHDEDRMLGFADLRPTQDVDGDAVTTGEIASFYVLPSLWRQGVGTALIAESVGRLTDAGYADATLWVHDANSRAIHFYERTGWSSDGATNLDTVGGQTINETRYRRSLVRSP